MPFAVNRLWSPIVWSMIAAAACARDVDSSKLEGNCSVWIGWLSE